MWKQKNNLLIGIKMTEFQKNLVVWKQKASSLGLTKEKIVSEELSSVETI